nr:hypothetical protein [Tanacetum cinerariifolium]
VKEYQEKDKIRSKPDKNEKRGEAEKSQKQLQSVEEEKLNKMLKEGPNLQSLPSCIRRKERTRTRIREEKRIEEKQAAKAQTWKLLLCYDDDDDEEGYNSLNDNIISELPPYSAVTPTEPIDSLRMGDEHLDTIPATESDEFIKSCVKNLVPYPSESEGKNGCDVLTGFTTFSNVLFDADYDSDSSDDQSLSDEDVPQKIYSNPLFDEEIIPMEIDQHSFNIDSLFNEFAGELTLLKSFPPRIDEIDCHPEKEIRLAKRLLYDNSSPRPPEEIVSDNSHADIESFSPSPIPNLDSDPLMEEIDLSFNLDDPMPPGIEDDDYESGRDIPILVELLDNYSLSLHTNESDYYDIPLPYRPPAKPPDVVQYSQKYKDSRQRILYSSLHFLFINWESRIQI